MATSQITSPASSSVDVVQIASFAVAALNAAAGIWYGIRAMVRSNEDRRHAVTQRREADDGRHEEAMAQQRKFAAQQREAEDRRHGEAMAALKELIRRTAAPGSGTGE